MTFRYVTLIAHRWLGLLTAVTLSILGVSGAPLIWQDHWRLRDIANAIEPFHVALGMGRVGYAFVVYSTLLGIPILLSGVILWWSRKGVRIETRMGWRRLLIDSHYSLGIFGFVLMLLLAITGLGMRVTPRQSQWRPIVARLHTTRGFPLPIKLLYGAATGAFFVQAVTGVVMWWKPSRRP